MKKTILIILSLLMFSGTAWADPYDDFSGDTLNGKWTPALVLGAGSYAVSGGNLNITATGGIPLGIYQVPTNDTDKDTDIFMTFTESGDTDDDCNTMMAIYKTDLTTDSMIIQIKANASAGAGKNFGDWQALQWMGVGAEKKFHMNIDASGNCTFKVYSHFTSAWETLVLPGSPITYPDNGFNFAILTLAETGKTWSSHVSSVSSSDSSTTTTTSTTLQTPSNGLTSWMGF